LQEEEQQPTYKPNCLNNLNPQEAEVLTQILYSLRQIKFGYIQITIQDAKVVQIDRTEKQRINCK